MNKALIHLLASLIVFMVSMCFSSHSSCARRILDTGVDTRALLLLFKLKCIAPV